MLLAVDTSTAQVGLALYDGTQVLSEMTWTTRQHHTTELAPALAGLLARSGSSMDMVSALGLYLLIIKPSNAFLKTALIGMHR